MKIGNPHRPVTSAWLTKEGHRLDAPPFLSGAVEARVLLDKLTVPKQRLSDVTAGYNGGIYNGPQFKRNYVTNQEHGVPFLGSSSMLQADLGDLPLISKKLANSPKLLPLHVKEGMTLISCSGTIGRTVYGRSEMVGLLTSQHIMKVVPDPSAILPGYLYAYLSSRFGKILITSGTYGAIIQHIEPEHISELKVPRFESDFEMRIHEMIEEAGHLRSSSAKLIQTISENFLRYMASDIEAETDSINLGFPSSNKILKRMDASFHSDKHNSVIQSISTVKHVMLGDICHDINEPPRIKRTIVDKGEWSVPFFGTSAIMNGEPEPSYYVNRKNLSDSFIVKENHILLPRSGQVSGIIGWPIMPVGTVKLGAVSEDAIRIVMPNIDQACFVFLFLRTRLGQTQLKSRAFGSSIPHLNPKEVGQVLVPWPSDSEVEAIGSEVFRAIQMRDRAIGLEASARHLIEQAIEENYVPPEV
ncbi:restriction endonuclease subunit S [Deinococcus sp. HMF7604]|uniref:methylation-associated defense system restriction endonuclease subunit S MAD5 n=1 Tax=Deinococcus betulae TaxID=2873312 RepID=UPI001CCAAB51|nr:restriction endonuclease subunit S [Deinococcus betulae]MBZ9752901.1 restriction endonuclease subunit S [Deinococcus betulae]